MDEELSASSSVEKRNWSEFPSHLLDIIMDKLSTLEFFSDYIRFGAVCVSWNSAFCDHDPPPHQFPPLLLTVPPPPPPTLNKKKTTRLQRFYNILEKTRLRRFYNILDESMDGRLEVRMPRYRHCRGSSHGWLITVDDDKDSNFAVRLFNPFLSTNGIEILLPSLKTFPVKSKYDLQNYGFLEKAVLSANPLTNPTDYTVMAIYGPSLRLAFFKPGNKRWTSIKSPKIKGCRLGYFADIIYCHGKFFVVHWDGAVVVVLDDDVGEGEGKGMIAKVVLQPPLSDLIYTKKYLVVESSGRELLQVHRSLNISVDRAQDGKMTYSTTGFRVFKLKITGGAKEEEYEWQEMKSLCGDSMFLGQNTSFSIRASDYPGCMPNSIYYTEDSDACIRWPQQVSDLGIFNLENGSFKRNLPIASKNTSPPIWIQPSLPNKNKKRSSSSSC